MVTFFCFLFLSLWLVNSEKEVQFQCSDDGEDLCLPDFPTGKNTHLEMKQSHLPELMEVKKKKCKSIMGQR